MAGVSGPQLRREEPRRDLRELAKKPLERQAGDEAVLIGEVCRQDAEGRRVPSLVVADALERLTLLLVGSELDQPPVRELGRRLERGVQLAVAPEGLVAQFRFQRRRDPPGRRLATFTSNVAVPVRSGADRASR